MTLPDAAPAATRYLSRPLRIAAGVAALSLIWWLGSELVSLLHVPVSGGVAGLLVLVTLLLAGWVPARWFAPGAQWMLSELILFFVPAVVSIIEYGNLLRHDGLRLMIIIVTGTLVVMLVTGVVVEWVTRLQTGSRARRFAAARRRRLSDSRTGQAGSRSLTPALKGTV